MAPSWVLGKQNGHLWLVKWWYVLITIPLLNATLTHTGKNCDLVWSVITTTGCWPQPATTKAWNLPIYVADRWELDLQCKSEELQVWLVECRTPSQCLLYCWVDEGRTAKMHLWRRLGEGVVLSRVFLIPGTQLWPLAVSIPSMSKSVQSMSPL